MHRLGRFMHAIAFPFTRVFFALQNRPRTRVWLTNQHGQLLLVKSWFGHQRWSLPGGGIERGETAQQAVCRELREETGIILPESAFEEYAQLRPREAVYDVIVFRATVDSDELPQLERIREMEIIGRQWVDPAHLPENSSPLVEDLSKELMLADSA